MHTCGTPCTRVRVLVFQYLVPVPVLQFQYQYLCMASILLYHWYTGTGLRVYRYSSTRVLEYSNINMRVCVLWWMVELVRVMPWYVYSTRPWTCTLEDTVYTCVHVYRYRYTVFTGLLDGHICNTGTCTGSMLPGTRVHTCTSSRLELHVAIAIPTRTE